MLNLETLYLLVGLSMVQIDDDALEHLLPGSDNAIMDIAPMEPLTAEASAPTDINILPHRHMLIDDEFVFGI
jgi:hypothetical protein